MNHEKILSTIMKFPNNFSTSYYGDIVKSSIIDRNLKKTQWGA
jgi:hypothetical protein